MYPLIEITRVPIEIQVKTRNAKLEYTGGTAEMEISRSDEGGVDIKSRPIKLNLDTFVSSGSTPIASPVSPTVTGQNIPPAPVSVPAASTPQTTTWEATAAYSEQGQIMLNARVNQGFQHQMAQLQNQVEQIQREPEREETPVQDSATDTGMDFEWEDGQMQIRYEMDKLQFDWKIDACEFKFTPGDIEISVKQKPSVTIKYLGGPIYVPPSADPDYEPVDVKA